MQTRTDLLSLPHTRHDINLDPNYFREVKTANFSQKSQVFFLPIKYKSEQSEGNSLSGGSIKGVRSLTQLNLD